MSNIEVYVRMRPFNQKQLYLPLANQRLQLDPSSGQVQVNNEHGNEAKRFSFNGVFDKQTTQQQLYQKCQIESMVDRVIEGYNSTILTYGQTGAGKTYTMDGDFAHLEQKNRINIDTSKVNNNLGLVPRILRQLFHKIQGQSNREYRVNLSFIQIYKENIYDLLSAKLQKQKQKQKPHQSLRLRWNKVQQFIVEKLKIKHCLNLQQALKVYIKGSSNKIIGKHKMNSHSSRSHSIFTIKIQSYKNEDPQNILVSKFCLVDLAGSEKQQLTGTLGKHFKQSIEINKSLFTLRQVISGLVESKSSNKDSMDDDCYIPYRDSKLTCLLKQSFGGNNYTIMIACLNPGNIYAEQSFQTLCYATMANKIKNVPIKGEDQRVIEIKKLKEQLNRMTDQLSKANNHIRTLTIMLQQKSMIIDQLKKGNHQPNSPTSPNIIKKQSIQSIQLQGCIKKHQNQLDQIQSIQVKLEQPKLSFPSRRSNQQILQSLVMVKQLVNSNMILRQNNQELSKTLYRKQKQIYELIKQNDRLRERWELFFNQVQSEKAMTIEYSNPMTRSIITPHNKTTDRLQSVRQIRKKRLNSLSVEQTQKQQTPVTYHQFLNSRYRVTAGGSKKSKSKKYSVL